jgi:hypothetical protein
MSIAVDRRPARSTQEQKEIPMQYLLLIYKDDAKWADMPADDQRRLYAEYIEFTKGIRTSGHYRGGDALQPTHTATSVRVRDGKTTATDGPFAETREQLGGYYLIEAKDLDEATAIAARVPTAKIGTIEVRPVKPTPDV